jgi:2-oxoglutarate ferredoxin oxidoreductase subunit alpha
MIAGQAGDGVLFTGNVLAKILKREGWEIVTYRDFPSNIRGETTNYTIRASHKKIYGRGDTINVLLAFDCDAIIRHLPSMAPGSIILCEGIDLAKIVSPLDRDVVYHQFPIRQLAKQRFGSEIFKNMIVLGALCYILDLETTIVHEIVRAAFLKKKGENIVQKNILAVKLGCEQAEEIVKPEEKHSLKKRQYSQKLFISGDEAIAFGALAAGCRFFAAYPICPASEIWQWLAKVFLRYNGLVIQTEDEIAAINMALGASYAGARAMTSTSGPGASLMMEGFSLAGMTEIPLVVVHVQRAGPSTGLPTKSEQADLNQWVYGGHGDFPRIVLSPGTIDECFIFTVKAFNLAEKYQVPVILLTEQDYGQNLRTTEKFNLSNIKIERGKLLTQEELLRIEEYKRYRFTRDGVSPRALPSMTNGIHMVESNEHDEKGYREESPPNRTRMMDKRMKKLKTAGKDLIPPRLWGNSEAETGIIGFGSTLGPIREAMDQLREQSLETKYLQVRTLWPFHSLEVDEFLSGCRRVFVVENNYSGQLNSLIKSQVRGCPEMNSVLNYSSQTFRPQEITAEIEKLIR